jgi:hypothetical protein
MNWSEVNNQALEEQSHFSIFIVAEPTPMDALIWTVGTCVTGTRASEASTVIPRKLSHLDFAFGPSARVHPGPRSCGLTT